MATAGSQDRRSIVSLAVGVALAFAPSAAGASSDEARGAVVDVVTISAPVQDVPAFGDGPVDAPVVVDGAETISAPVDDDDGLPAGAIGGGVVTVGAAIAGSVALHRARARNTIA